MQGNTSHSPKNPSVGLQLSPDQALALISAYRAWAATHTSKVAAMFATAALKAEGQLEKGAGFEPIPVPDLRDTDDVPTTKAFRDFVEKRRGDLQAVALRLELPGYLDVAFSEPGASGRGHKVFITWEVRELLKPETHDGSDQVSYRSIPVMAAWPFRWMFAPDGGLQRSTTGWLLGLALMAGGLAVLLLALPILVLQYSPTLSGSTLASLVMFTALGIALFLGVRPLWSLPDYKLVIAPWWILSTKEPFGQIHLGPRIKGRVGMRPSGLFRYTTECPICGSDVELADGRRQYPDRIVGRCLDAPTEHVVSFDPVTKHGKLLLPDQLG